MILLSAMRLLLVIEFISNRHTLTLSKTRVSLEVWCVCAVVLAEATCIVSVARCMLTFGRWQCALLTLHAVAVPPGHKQAR